jgi:RNA polymerase sigma factor (sigma-70 family)
MGFSTQGVIAMLAHTVDDALAWMSGRDPDAPAPRPADDVVGQALDDLLGDWSRRGAQLTSAEVAVLATRRNLSVAQYGELLTLLGEAGVDLPQVADPRPKRAATAGYELRRDSVGHYLRAIGRYPLIDGVREVELWSLISQGIAAQEELAVGGNGLPPDARHSLHIRSVAGRRAHAELVCANLRLVVSIAKARQYESSGVEFADRIQDGNIGLLRAAGKFDGAKGFKFSTYATWWIKQSIERGIGDRGRTIRVPLHMHEKMQRVRKAVGRLTERLDREPTAAEVAEVTDIDRGAVQAILDLMQPIRSLDALLGDSGDLRLSDTLVCTGERDGRADPAESYEPSCHRGRRASSDADLDSVPTSRRPSR